MEMSRGGFGTAALKEFGDRFDRDAEIPAAGIGVSVEIEKGAE
jgi:hypothetical protein